MSSKLILLADDETSLRQLGQALLSEAGYRVITAENGRECVEKFRELGGENVSLVILDFAMPLMNGREALRAILEIYPAARVVINSASASPEELVEMKTIGAMGAIPKPYRREELLHHVRAALGE